MSHKDLLSSIAELSEISIASPGEENWKRYCQTVDRPCKYPGWSDPITHPRSSDDPKHSSGESRSYLAQILACRPFANCCITRFVLNPSSSASINTANKKSLSLLQSVNQPGQAIHTEGAHDIKKDQVMKSQHYYDARHDLLKRLEQGDSEGGLRDELKVMINMMERMNTLLRGLGGTPIVGAPKIKMNVGTINQGMALAAQMKHYFNTLGTKYEFQVRNITQIKSYLPNLGPHVKSTLLRYGLKICNERIIITSNLAAPQPYEQDTFTRLATFYATKVFTIFLIKPQYPSAHPLHSLAATLLDHIPRSLERVCAAHASLMHETKKLAKAINEARARLPSVLGPTGCVHAYRHELYFQDAIAELERKVREAGKALDASVREGPERRMRQARGTLGGYPVISLRQYMATATARRERAAAEKGRVKARRGCGDGTIEGKASDGG